MVDFLYLILLNAVKCVFFNCSLLVGCLLFGVRGHADVGVFMVARLCWHAYACVHALVYIYYTV